MEIVREIPETMWGTTVYSILFPHTSPYLTKLEHVIAWFNSIVAEDNEKMEDFRAEGSVDIYQYKVSSSGDLIDVCCIHSFDFEKGKWI